MNLTHDPTGPERAIVVAGAGAVGLAAAIGLARAGRPVTLVGTPGPERVGRTVALLNGAVALLRELEVWASVAPEAAPLAAMRIVDATGSLFRPPPVLFRAADLGVPAFGYNVPNASLERALWAEARVTPGLTIRDGRVADVLVRPGGVRVTTEGGDTVTGSLAVAADGRRSRVRRAVRIGVRETRHPQQALTALLDHEVPHAGISTEFHTRQGPFTLVPLPDGPDGGPRSSLVWVMSPAEAERRAALPAGTLAAEMERQCGRLLGRITLAGPVGRFPIVTSIATRLVAERVVLIGEAAHALPPIGAQGLNLSFRDVAALIAHLRRDTRPGDALTLKAYARARAGDIASRTAGVGLLNGSLLAHTPAVDLLRGAGLLALGRSERLRRFAMRHGLAPDGTVLGAPRGSGTGVAAPT